MDRESLCACVSLFLGRELAKPFLCANEARLVLRVQVVEFDAVVRPVAPGAIRLPVELAPAKVDGLLRSIPDKL